MFTSIKTIGRCVEDIVVEIESVGRRACSKTGPVHTIVLTLSSSLNPIHTRIEDVLLSASPPFWLARRRGDQI